MEDKNTEQEETETGSTGSNKSLKETFKSGSPDDVHDRVKDVVEKGVAAVAGALKGFADETERSKVPETSKSAVHQAGETVRNTASSVTEEAKNLKAPLKEAGQKISETARDLRSTAQEEYRSTKDAIKGSGSSLGSSETRSPISGGSLSGSQTDLGPTTGSSLGRTSRSPLTQSGTGLGTEMPDISRTPLAESDRKLQGKDLASDVEEDTQT